MPSSARQRAIQRAAPSLVLVTAERGAGEAAAVGSGFVLRADGVIATAYHLARAAARLEVRGVGWPRPLVASLVAKDEAADVALLRVLAHDLPALALADEEVPLGADVVFLGFPYSDVFEPPLALTTAGILGNRYRMGGVTRLVVDAVCAEGCSGGPLVLVDSARVIGVVGARFDATRTRAKLRGASPEELARLAPEPSAITFATDASYLAKLCATVR